MDQVQLAWFSWGAYAAFVVALLATFWVFFDVMRKGHSAPLWMLLTLVAAVATLPSVAFSVLTELQTTYPLAVQPVLWSGVAATVVALLALSLYVFGVGVWRNPGHVTPLPEHMPPTNAGSQGQVDQEAKSYGATRSDEFPTGAMLREMGTQWEGERLTEPGQATDSGIGISSTAEGDARTYEAGSSDRTVQIPSGVAGRYTDGAANGAGGSSDTISISRKRTPGYFAYLVLLSSTHAGSYFQLDETTNLGRQGDTNDIVLEDNRASRDHARIRCLEGRFVLTDLASSNGTFVRGDAQSEWQEVHEITLEDGMRLKIGDTELAFLQVSAPSVAGKLGG